MIDVLIPLGPKDADVARICALSVRKYVMDIRTIWVIGQKNPGIPGTIFVQEGELPFSLEEVKGILGINERAGWYFQQLVKLYAPILIPSILQQYLVVDADTFFLKKCRFVEEGRPAFNVGIEYHHPYFEHMTRLHPNLIKPMIYSGITHTLVYDRVWLQDMRRLIEAHHQEKPFWRIYLEQVDPVHKNASGAAENELYFTYCILMHINEVVIKAIKWANISSINEISDLYTYVSLHWYLRDDKLDIAALERRVLGDSKK